jgi:iron-sulfur cluster repair protein YtfE (RIC family)
MRYQFYREHKYVSSALNDLERMIAKTDFRNPSEVIEVNQAFRSLTELLKGHAQYEDERLHALLKKRDSKIHEHAEKDHEHQEEQLLIIRDLISSISSAVTDEEKVSEGYTLYLTYRKFVADNLLHLHEEETVILPEIQRLYTDDELKQIEAPTYEQMTSEEMVEMMQVLFPHMNPSDRIAILSDIQQIQPEKFISAWQGIASKLTPEEQASISLQLQIQ